MADNPYINKVMFGDETIIDLTDATATAADIAQGATAYGATGELLTGTATGGGRCTWYGTSSTTASTAAKVVTCEGFTLTTGNLIAILFTTANTAATPTLNVNSTGAVSIRVGNTAPSATTNVLKWSANTVLYFMYDGTYFRYLGAQAAGSVQQPDGAGAWYGTSSTAATTAAKTSTIANFRLTSGAFVAIRFSTANTYVSGALTLNVNSTGAKTIYKGASATSSTNTLTWSANSTLYFQYDGSYWRYLGSDAESGGGSYTLPVASTSTLGGIKIDTESFWMNGEVLMLSVPFYRVWKDYEPTYAEVSEAIVTDGRVPVIVETEPDTFIGHMHIAKDWYLDTTGGDGYNILFIYYDRYDYDTNAVVPMEAMCVEETGQWVYATNYDQAHTIIETVDITVSSTASGTNAANLHGYVTVDGYTAKAIAGYTWKSGTRQNFFNIYRLDVSDSGMVTVSLCNLHGSQAANGVLTVSVLMERTY